MEYRISNDQLNTLFPFFVHFDKQLNVIDTGLSLQKMLGNHSGKSFDEVFDFVRPRLSISSSYESFVEHRNVVVILEAKEYPIRVRFRGQFLPLDHDSGIMYICTPWLVDARELQLHNLNMNDFALHDPIVDQIQLIQAKENVNEDLKELTRILTQQRDELSLKNETIQEVAKFPEQNPHPILRLQYDGSLIYANPSAKKLIEKEDLLDPEIWNETLGLLREGKLEVPMKQLNIGNQVYQVSIVPFPNKGYFNCYLSEITDSVNFQNELIQTTNYLHGLLSNLQSGILVESKDRKIVLTNTEFCKLFAIPMSPEEMKGLDCANAADQFASLFSDSEAFISRINQILSEQKPVYGDILNLANGRVWERDFIPIQDQNGVKGTIWRYQDITELIRSKERYKRVEEKYKRIIEELNFGLIEVDKQENITRAFPAFSELTGYSVEELTGMNVRDLIYDEQSLEALNEQNKLRKFGKSGVYELQMRSKDGKPIWGIVSGTPIFNDEKEQIGSLGILVDITNQKHLESALREANSKVLESMKAKEQFLANMSHEMRSPLNVIIGMSELLELQALDQQQQKYVRAVQHSSQHLLHLINDVLDYSKIEAGFLKITPVIFDLNILVSDVINDFEVRAKEKNLQFVHQIDPDIPVSILGDARKLTQVLFNLISNAIKFTDTGKIELRVLVREKSDDLVKIDFEITDTGIGMSNDFLQNIFKPFIQEDSSFSRSHGGTGLGLAISKNIIEKCGGNLFVESHKNKGSKFSFELSFPICYTSSKKSGTQTTSSDQFNSNLRILVAEDNVLNQQLIIALLEKANLDHVVVNDGIDALKVLQKESFDLVLMDIQMPRMDGLTTLRHIRESLQLDIPVVALTANATKEDQERFINAGMNGYLSKPYKKDDLFQLIRNLSTQPVEKEKSEPTLFSIKTISELAGGDQSFINSIVQSFIIETPVKLSAIEKAIETEDAQAVAFQTHQLKSMVDILEIYITSDLVKQMERESKKEVNDWTLIESLYIDVKNTLLETIEQLKRL